MGRRQFLRAGGAMALGAVIPGALARAETGTSGTNASEPHGVGRNPVPSDLSRNLPVWMQTARVPGLVVASLRDGRVDGVFGFGRRHADAQDPVTSETVFEAASLSKVVTAYSALQLVQQNKLQLDEPLATYAASPCDAGEALAARVTLRHAPTHSPGFRNWRFRKDEKLTVDFEPGSKFSYSGEGFIWVERAIEAVTGQPFALHAQKSIFEPLGLVVSSFVWRPEFEQSAARGHDEKGQVSESWVMRLARKADEVGKTKAKPPLEWRYADAEKALVDSDYPPLATMVTPNAAGSLFTTAGEYATFFSRVLEKTARDSASLSNDMRAAMRTPQIQAAGAIWWGLGASIETDRKPPLVWHWGDSGPAKRFAIGDPTSGRGVVVFTNGSRGLGLCERIANAVMPGLHSSFLFI